MNHEGNPPAEGRSFGDAPFGEGYLVKVVDGFWSGHSGTVLRREGGDLDFYGVQLDGGMVVVIRRAFLAPQAGVVHVQTPEAPAREADAEREKDEVTPDSIRKHAEWFLAAGKPSMADVLLEEADDLQKRQDAARAEAERDNRIVRLIDHLGEAYITGIYDSGGTLAKVGWDAYTEEARETVRTGLRNVLKALAKLDTGNEQTRKEFTRDAIVEELTEAIRLSVEYVGVETLPPVKGWSWYDAMVKYAPDTAERFCRDWENIRADAQAEADSLAEESGVDPYPVCPAYEGVTLGGSGSASSSVRHCSLPDGHAGRHVDNLLGPFGALR